MQLKLLSHLLFNFRFSKILKCAANDDIITLKAEDQPDECNLLFQSANDDKTSDFIIKLTDIDQETLGIPVSSLSVINTFRFTDAFLCSGVLN